MADQLNEQKNITAYDVADFFLAKANSVGEPITNLKLQKLTYYAQAWFLANKHKPLFEEDFEAWVHGPVQPDLYQKYKERGSTPIITNLELKEVAGRFDEKTFGFLNEVAEVYMPYGAFQLELMTHKEKPWIDARGNFEPDEKCNKIISKSSIENFYAEKIQNKTN
ncbi:MAG: type II toxin-antitoxin system antitoxin SocA domain-containing protein [bacterium]